MLNRGKIEIVLTVAAAVLSACGNGVFNTEPMVDARRDEVGNVILEDTPRMWQEYVESVDRYIAKELSGGKPPAGRVNWDDYWLWRISNISEHQENREKYFFYIVESRRDAALPELSASEPDYR